MWTTLFFDNSTGKRPAKICERIFTKQTSHEEGKGKDSEEGDGGGGGEKEMICGLKSKAKPCKGLNWTSLLNCSCFENTKYQNITTICRMYEISRHTKSHTFGFCWWFGSKWPHAIKSVEMNVKTLGFAETNEDEFAGFQHKQFTIDEGYSKRTHSPKKHNARPNYIN